MRSYITPTLRAVRFGVHQRRLYSIQDEPTRLVKAMKDAGVRRGYACYDPETKSIRTSNACLDPVKQVCDRIKAAV